MISDRWFFANLTLGAAALTAALLWGADVLDHWWRAADGMLATTGAFATTALAMAAGTAILATAFFGWNAARAWCR